MSTVKSRECVHSKYTPGQKAGNCKAQPLSVNDMFKCSKDGVCINIVPCPTAELFYGPVDNVVKTQE